MSTENTIKRLDPTTTVLQAADLHLLLYDRPLHPELFRHYAAYRVSQGQYHTDIWIVGLSHVVTLTRGQRSVTEVLCPDSDLLPTRGLISRFRLKGERDQERRLPDGWCHMISSQVETMDEPLYKSVHNDLLRHAQKRGWYVPYDQWGEGELVPFSYMDHEARDSEFHIHAFHAFPHDRTLVKTQSIFELAG
ncbi:MAG: DUF2617 family protein [Phycisphaerae bacterium]|jgi:hypothetical protein